MTPYAIKFYINNDRGNLNLPRVYVVNRCVSRNENLVYCNTILDVKLVYNKYKMADRNFILDSIKTKNFSFLSYAIIPDVRYSNKVVCRLFQTIFEFKTTFRFI